MISQETEYWETRKKLRKLVEAGYIDESRFEETLESYFKKQNSINNKDKE